MNPTRILLADDHTLVRAGIRSLLEKLTGIEIVAEASNGRAVLEWIQNHALDLILMDIMMPELNGIETARYIAKYFPKLRVIILSMYANEEYIAHALQAGAAGYLLKDAATAELELAIRAVTRGETYLSPPISKHAVEEYLERVNRSQQSDSAVPSPFERLTPRQRQILQLIAEGHTMQDIANKLRVSVKTVETHRAQLMARLGIYDLAGLVRYAIRTGITQG